MKFNKGKCKVLPLWRNNPKCKYTLGAYWLKDNLEKKDLRVLVTKSLNLIQECAIMAKQDNSLPGGFRQTVASR